MSSEVNGTAKFYLFIANNFNGSTDNMIAAMDTNSDGYLIKAEFTKYMKEHWAGNYTDNELNQFWSRFDQERDGKLEGTNLRNLNALDETELKKLEAQVEVYNEIKKYIEEKVKGYQDVVREFGIDPNQFSNSVKLSLFNTIEAFIDRNFGQPNLEEQLKGIVDTNIETAVTKTVANLYGQNYINTYLKEHPDVKKDMTPEVYEQLQDRISAYVNSGELKLENIKADIEKIINEYFDLALAGTNSGSGVGGGTGTGEVGDEPTGLTALQINILTRKITEALNAEASRFAAFADDFNNLISQFLDKKINSGLSYQELLDAIENGSLVEEFKSSNEYKALEVLVNYLDIEPGIIETGVSKLPARPSFLKYTGTKTIYSTVATRQENFDYAKDRANQIEKARKAIGEILESTFTLMKNNGCDVLAADSAKNAATLNYATLLDGGVNADGHGVYVKFYGNSTEIVINNDNVIDHMVELYNSYVSGTTTGGKLKNNAAKAADEKQPENFEKFNGALTPASELFNKIAATYSQEFAEYVAEHDTDPDYGYADVVRAVAQRVASGELKTEDQIQSAIVKELKGLYQVFKVDSDDSVTSATSDYFADWAVDTNNVHLYSGGKPQKFTCSAVITDKDGNTINSSQNNQITYEVGTLGGNTGSSATINSDTGEITITPGCNDGVVYVPVKVKLNGNEIQTKTITLNVNTKPGTSNIDNLQLPSSAHAYNFAEETVFNYKSIPEMLKKAAIQDGWDASLANKAAKTLSNYYKAVISVINTYATDSTLHDKWKLSEKVAFNISGSSSYENTVTGETVEISPTVPAIIADASHSDWSDGREDFGDVTSSTGIYMAYTKHGNKISGIWYDESMFIDNNVIKNQFKAFLQQGLYL